ncbi:unnamed protein product [Trichobilharzia regenti]|nr:unnamed protein product [Trichobilharzia regenti]
MSALSSRFLTGRLVAIRRNANAFSSPLNTRLSSDLPCSSPTFVEEYFTCPCKCTSCGVRCCLSVNHTSNNVAHKAECLDSSGINTTPCRYDPTLQNKLYFCKLCYAYGQRTMMVPKSGESNAVCESTV